MGGFLKKHNLPSNFSSVPTLPTLRPTCVTGESSCPAGCGPELPSPLDHQGDTSSSQRTPTPCSSSCGQGGRMPGAAPSRGCSYSRAPWSEAVGSLKPKGSKQSKKGLRTSLGIWFLFLTLSLKGGWVGSDLIPNKPSGVSLP